MPGSSRGRRADAVVVTAEGVVTRAVLESGRQGLDEQGVAGRLCRACVAELDVDGAAVSLLTGSASRVTVATTDPVAQMLEDLQFTLNEGACMQAAGSGRPVLVADLRDRTLTAAWPLFADAVLEGSAVAALFALPLQWGAVNLGVLDLYRLVPGSLDDAQWRDAADAVGILLGDARRELRAVAASSEDAETMELLQLQSDRCTRPRYGSAARRSVRWGCSAANPARCRGPTWSWGRPWPTSPRSGSCPSAPSATARSSTSSCRPR